MRRVKVSMMCVRLRGKKEGVEWWTWLLHWQLGVGLKGGFEEGEGTTLVVTSLLVSH